VAAASFAVGVVTSPPCARAARCAPRAARAEAHRLVPVLATRSFLIDVHVLGSRDY
jgi:hypothetical protein